MDRLARSLYRTFIIESNSCNYYEKALFTLYSGLRIAPPEAPVTGYMFGKGVYFADMVSKSANYCFTDPSNPVGVLLLSEVPPES